MHSYNTSYKQKSWLNKSFDNKELSAPKLNKKGGKDKSFQWSYNNKNKFTTRSGSGDPIKKKKPKNKNKYISNRNSVLSDMYFKEHSQSSLPNGSSVDKRTVVDIVDSDMDICFRENNYKKLNKRKKLNDNSSIVTPAHNHSKENDLFFFDLCGNPSLKPSPAKHIHFGDNTETLDKTSTSLNSPACSVVSVQSNMIQKSKKARNISNQPNFEELLSPTLVKPKKRKKLSVSSDSNLTSQKEFNLEDAGNSLMSEIKKSPTAKKSKHFMEYKPSDSANTNESFVGSKHEKSSNVIKSNNESEKNIGTNKHGSASNVDDDKMYEIIQNNLIMGDLGNNPKSLFKTTTCSDTPKLSTNALINVLSDVNPNNASAKNNINNSTDFNMKKLGDNSIIMKKKVNSHSELNSSTELAVKNKKKKKFSEEQGDFKSVCASELENSNGRSVISSIDCDNSVTVRRKKENNHTDLNSRTELSVENKEKKKFSEKCGDMKTVSASELESSDGRSVIDIIECNNSVTFRRKKKSNHSDANSRTEFSVKNKKKNKFSEECGDMKTVCASELESSDGRSVIDIIECDNSVTFRRKKKSNHSDLNSRTELPVKNKKKKTFSEECGDMKTVLTSELESSAGRSGINSIDCNNSGTVRKKEKRLADHVVMNKGKKASNGSIIDNSNFISDDNIDGNEKKSPKDNSESEFSDTFELLEKDKVIEETFNKLDVNASKVCKLYNKLESINYRHSPASVHDKLNIEDVFTDDSNDESTTSETKLYNKLANLDEDEGQTLAELEIVLPFKTIPLLHNIQRPSKPTPEETQLAKILNAKRGPFSKHEDEQIVTNWENFCKDHNLSVKPSVFFKFHRSVPKGKKIKFLQYISHKLDNRHPLHVHSRFQRLYSNNDIKTGRFTKKEDEQIVNFINKNNSKTPNRDLGILLGRSAHSINRRISLLADTRHGDKTGWNIELSKRLIEGMFTVTGLKRVEDLEHVTFDAGQWRKLSILLDNIPEKKLHGAWVLNVHPKLFLKETNDTIKRDLIKMMMVNKEKDFRTVNWKKYSDNFNGINERKLYELFINMMRQIVPKKKWSNLRSVVKFLSKTTYRSRNIHRYIYKDGELKII